MAIDDVLYDSKAQPGSTLLPGTTANLPGKSLCKAGNMFR